MPPRKPETKRTPPHEWAKVRFLDAVAFSRVADRLRTEADAEYEAASAELRMYRNPDGTPLPEDQQWDIHNQLRLPAVP